jgi:HD-like signal output (HDOD) protein
MTGNPPTLVNTTAPTAPSALDAAVARVRNADDFPAIAGRINQLVAALGEEDASVQHLAGLIVQDYSLTVKLLRVANSFRFNRSAAPILSANHAIVMMGADAVRQLATTVVVLEHFRSRSPALRPLLMMSLLTANHARELATSVGTVGSEEAYLAGMLRNLGEVLVACYMPDEYAAVLNDIAEHQSSPAVACRRVLHFEYEELGQVVLRDWGMPESVAATMSAIGGKDELHKVVSFAHSLTSAVYRSGAESSSDAVKRLMQKYSSLQLSREEVAAILEAGIEGTRETFKLAGVKLDDLQLKQQMIAAVADEAESQPGESGEPAAAVPPAAGSEPRTRVTGKTKQAIDDGQLELNTILLDLLQRALKAGNFSRAVLSLVSATRRDLCGRLGAGEAGEDFVARFRFALGPTGGPLGVAASRGQELVLAGSRGIMPGERRLLQSHRTGALLMVPLVEGGRTIGALYVDTPLDAQIASNIVATVRQVRDAIVQALARQDMAA